MTWAIISEGLTSNTVVNQSIYRQNSINLSERRSQYSLAGLVRCGTTTFHIILTQGCRVSCVWDGSLTCLSWIKAQFEIPRSW